MEARHTPGPWRFTRVGLGRHIGKYVETLGMGRDEALWSDATGQPVAVPTLADRVGFTSFGFSDADANLVAAAPELLAALEAFAAIHDNSPDNTPWGCGLTNGHFFRAKEAIAKAKGGAP